MVAPSVLIRHVDARWVEAYLEHALVLAYTKDDVAIMDNLQAKKVNVQNSLTQQAQRHPCCCLVTRLQTD